MTDPITLGLASTAVSLVNGTLSMLKEARESAKRSDDNDLKDKLSEVFDSVLEIKEVVGNLKEENGELRRQLQARASLKWDTGRKLYFVDGDPDPFCPSCFDLHARQVRLHPIYTGGSHWKDECKICKSQYQFLRDR
jgi:hypothetical protein